MKNKIVISRILLIIVGIVFIISAIAKLLSIDSFEIYIYSFGFFNLNISFIIARLLIGFELVLGICLALSVFPKQMSYLAIASLVGFTCFLAYLLISKKEEHCHCFGNMIELSHTMSIIKNLILCGLLIPGILLPFKNIWYHKILVGIIFTAGLVTPFVYSTPDNLIKHESNASYQQVYLDEFLNENPHLTQGRKVVSFIGTGCKFCKLASRKLTVISNKANNFSDVFYVVWGTEETLNHFFEETHSYHFNNTLLPARIFIRITNGQMPLILLLENGKVIKKYDYRELNEKEIISFLSPNK